MALFKVTYGYIHFHRNIYLLPIFGEGIPEDTHHRGEHHYTADLLIDWFGFDQSSKANSTQAKQLNPNKINRRSAVQ